MFKTINGGKIPTKGSKFSACVDLYANEDVCIGAGETKIVGLGVCLDIETFLGGIDNSEWQEDFLKSHYFQLEPRSSLRAKGIMAGTGVIDIDFVPNCSINKNMNSKNCTNFKQK
jgi:dUTPase